MKLPTMLLAGVLAFYTVGVGLAVASIICNILVWGRFNVFGYVMPFYPFVGGLVAGLAIGRFEASFRVGLAISVIVPTALAFLEGTVFHAAYLRVLMHPVPHFQIRFPVWLFFPLIIACSFVGFKVAAGRRLKRQTKPSASQ